MHLFESLRDLTMKELEEEVQAWHDILKHTGMKSKIYHNLLVMEINRRKKESKK